MNITIESFFLVAEQDHIQVPSNENNFCAWCRWATSLKISPTIRWSVCAHGYWRNQLKKITLHRLTYIQWSPNIIYWWNHTFQLHQRQNCSSKPIQSLSYIWLLYSYWEFCSNKAVDFNGSQIYKLVNVQLCITTIQYLHWNITNNVFFKRGCDRSSRYNASISII
jgi:hypothetical protein